MDLFCYHIVAVLLLFCYHIVAVLLMFQFNYSSKDPYIDVPIHVAWDRDKYIDKPNDIHGEFRKQVGFFFGLVSLLV